MRKVEEGPTGAYENKDKYLNAEELLEELEPYGYVVEYILEPFDFIGLHLAPGEVVEGKVRYRIYKPLEGN